MYPKDGKMYFNTMKELYYNLFADLGLSINSDQYIYDQDTGITLKFKDKYMKMDFFKDVYAGNNDIVFDPSTNYNLIITLFGYFVEKEAANGNDIGFIAQYTEEEPNSKNISAKGARYKQRLVVKTKNGDIYSNFYYNLYLAYIEVIFTIAGSTEFDLSNFDILPDV